MVKSPSREYLASGLCYSPSCVKLTALQRHIRKQSSDHWPGIANSKDLSLVNGTAIDLFQKALSMSGRLRTYREATALRHRRLEVMSFQGPAQYGVVVMNWATADWEFGGCRIGVFHS